MKKVVRLSENDLIRIVKRVINEERYGSFGNLRRKDFRGDEWVRDDDRYMGDEIEGIDDDNVFDTEEFDDYETYSKRYPEDIEDSPRWFRDDRFGPGGKSLFDAYRNKTGRPFKVKTRRPRKD